MKKKIKETKRTNKRVEEKPKFITIPFSTVRTLIKLDSVSYFGISEGLIEDAEGNKVEWNTNLREVTIIPSEKKNTN